VCRRRRFYLGPCEPENCLLPCEQLLFFYESDGCGAGTFAALADRVLDRLPLSQLFEGNSLNFRVVEEQVVPLTFNKPKTTIRYQPLDLTLWHLCPPEKNF
jgi:hypothetical protein